MKKIGIIINCKTCKSPFYAPKWWREKAAKFCSKKCYWKSKLGMVTWNKGTVGLLKKNKGSFLKCEPDWKGTLSEYKNLHYWLNKELGKATLCVKCGSKENVAWANISHKYNRILDDYFPLCYSCHFKHDNGEKRRIKNGRT